MKTWSIFGALFLLVVLLMGCSTPGTITPTGTFVSPLESPLTTPPSAAKATPIIQNLELPTPVDNMATVGGTLYLDVAGEPLHPLANARIFLGEVHISEDGTKRIAGYSESTSPQSITDAQGHFVIHTVPPDTYNLIVVRYMDPVFMTEHESGESLVFTLEAGDVLDLGEIHYTAVD